ncbi:hypothetical protein BH10PSE17_BH10PSE17_10130 [soil metagenome]
MITFLVNDMSCNHCVGSITAAVKAVDADATIAIDLPRHLVQIEPDTASAGRLREAIADAGYTPTAL